jgi:hypothetical protein
MTSYDHNMYSMPNNETMASMYYDDYPAMSSTISVSPFALFTSDFWIQTTFSMSAYSIRWNQTGADVKKFIAHHADIGDEDGVLNPVEDVSVNAVWTAAVLNSIVGVMMLLFYELLRRVMPSVYGRVLTDDFAVVNSSSSNSHRDKATPSKKSSWSTWWILHVLKIPWSEVRVKVGLDAYMFLRYIRLMMRITSISAFWGMIVLWPTFYSGDGMANGWYTYSMANIEQSDWRMWIPFCFIYFMSAYVLWSIRQEYKHYLSQRMDFLSGRCEIQHVHPQQRYSIMVDSIPKELRSDQALFDYFSSLFPNRVHSARVILNLPDLEKISLKRVRITRRLEKSIAILEATGKRPQHIVGRPRCICMGIESEVSRRLNDIECSCGDDNKDVWNKFTDTPPRRGYLADSIDYYTRELANINESMEEEQKRKLELAELGNIALQASVWIESQEQGMKVEPLSKTPTPRHSNTSTDGNGSAKMIVTTQYGSLDEQNPPKTVKSNDIDEDSKQWRLLDDSFFLVRKVLQK